MLSDRTTAKILGLIAFVVTMLIVASCIFFARPETRSQPRFAVVVALGALPMLAGCAYAFVRARTLPQSDDDSER